MGLINLYNSLQQSNFDTLDPEWVQFVRDHYFYLRKNSTEFTITPGDNQRFAYRLRSFVSEQGGQIDMDWIICLINQLPSTMEFINRTAIKIPSYNSIQRLRQLYVNVQAKKETLDKK